MACTKKDLIKKETEETTLYKKGGALIFNSAFSRTCTLGSKKMIKLSTDDKVIHRSKGQIPTSQNSIPSDPCSKEMQGVAKITDHSRTVSPFPVYKCLCHLSTTAL